MGESRSRTRITAQGHEAVAVVTRARLPYRLFVLKGPGSHQRVVVDVAHRW
ncbi:AMIN-like domain-containing (lipo)protein [Arsenicicoccus dermatophilus]|uniref:AMIN-like domain-containing (lipo)protein n=1 Tax=Arsenicicoccus dermatophilus TaxID=1076331 RepID=UPI003B97DC08